MATRADVASLAKVSPAVVSYVINGGPRPVSAATRARVVAAIESLDYRPNAIASALRGGLTKSIGLLMPSPTNPYFAELADAIERDLFEARNLLSIGITYDDATRERVHLRSIVDRRVDGIILVSSRAVTKATVAEIRGTPIVVVDRADDNRDFPSVQVENSLDASYAVEHLQSWGHRLIGCVAGPWPIPLSMQRVDGWLRQQREVGAPHGADLIAHAEFSPQGGAEAARALLGAEGQPMASRGMRPTALFVSSDAQAHGVLQACEDLGLRVPEDVSIVSFDGTQSARFSRPPLTTMRQPISEIGSTAVRLLLERVADPSMVPETVSFRSNLVLGNSCAPVP